MMNVYCVHILEPAFLEKKKMGASLPMAGLPIACIQSWPTKHSYINSRATHIHKQQEMQPALPFADQPMHFLQAPLRLLLRPPIERWDTLSPRSIMNIVASRTHIPILHVYYLLILSHTHLVHAARLPYCLTPPFSAGPFLSAYFFGWMGPRKGHIFPKFMFFIFFPLLPSTYCATTAH